MDLEAAATAAAALRGKQGLKAAARNAELMAANAARILCPSCNFVAVNHAQFSLHAYAHLQDHRTPAAQGGQRHSNAPRSTHAANLPIGQTLFPHGSATASAPTSRQALK